MCAADLQHRTDRERGSRGGVGIYGGRANVVCMLTVFLVTLQASRERGERQELRTLLYICRPVFISVAASLVFPMKLHTYIYLVYICVGVPQKAKDKSQFCHSLVVLVSFCGTFELHITNSRESNLL